MARPQKQYSEEQKDEIKKAYKHSKQAKEQKRLMCLKLRICEGYPTKQIAAIVEYTPTFANEIISKYNRYGLSNVMLKKQGGNRRNLSKSDEKDLLEAFFQKAQAGQMLVINEIQEAYQKQIGRKVPKSSVYNMLHRNGWRKIMPRSKHPNKASDEAIAAYKKNR